MVFTVNVACDLYGRKCNRRLEFGSCPTLSELINAVESQFDVEARSSRPSGYPDIPFRVQTFQIFDDILRRWVDLYSPSQLTHGCQVYAFQPETVWNSDVIGTIPPPQDTISWSSTVGSPRRARIASDVGVPPTMSEKLRSVFYDLDLGNKGYILYTDLRAAFSRCDIEFTYQTVGELFNRADRDRDGHVSYEEWVRFAMDYPNVVDALFFRCRDIATDRSISFNRSGLTEDLAFQRRQREIELERMYRDSLIAAERSRVEREYEEARVEAELARQRARDAELRERSIRDRLLYSPSSPSRFY